VSNLRPIRTGNLRAAPAGLTPDLVGRFLALADMLGGHTDPFPQDASIAASGRTPGDVQAPMIAAEEAGRDSISGGSR